MPLGVIAKKVGMSRMFLPSGEAVAVTYLKVEPNVVVRMKNKEKDGYIAVILGIQPKTWKTKSGKERTRWGVQKEWAVDSAEGLEPGKVLTAEVIPAQSLVTISGTSKGKGFQGVVKRHGFAGGPASHGSHFKREPGSIGMRTDPGRIFRGHPMAGHMGKATHSLKHRPVLSCDAGSGVIGVKGPVPGPNGAPLYITLESSPAS
jgi:large subunit ribosomal protein L3